MAVETIAHPAAAHDIGGRNGGSIRRDEHDYAIWERRVDAMFMLLSRRGLLVVDEFRRHIESLGPGAYADMGYYERWVAALASAVNERGLVTSGELARRMAEVERRT